MYRLNIKKYRKIKNISQEKLALKVGVSQGYISQLEQYPIRTKSPKLELIEKIALELKVCPNDILEYVCYNCPLNTTCPKHNNMPLTF